MIERDFALRFAHEWIAAWNARDLERVLAHYRDDFEMASPAIARLAHEPAGVLRGKEAIRRYWQAALAQRPDLHFELLDVLSGAQSITLLYRGHRGLSAEVFWFDDALRVYRAAAHYGSMQTPRSGTGDRSMTDSKPPIAVCAAAVAPRAKPSNYPEPFASRVAGRQKRALGDVFGLVNFGVNLTRLAPGALSALRHAHAKQDEFIYILEGHPVLITDRGETPLAPGTCAGFKAGTGDAHHLLNRGTTDVVYLEVGDRSPGDAVVYPDDDIQALAGPDGQWRFTRKDGTAL